MYTLHRPRSGLVGIAPGAFDLINTGHLALLRAAARRCDHLIVAVSSDRLLRVRTGHDPAMVTRERAAVVGALTWVDSVVVDDDADRTHCWARYGAQIVFKGAGWAGTPGGRALERSAARVGARLEYLPFGGVPTLEGMRRAARSIGCGETGWGTHRPEPPDLADVDEAVDSVEPAEPAAVAEPPWVVRGA